jgi:hypothetical protein
MRMGYRRGARDTCCRRDEARRDALGRASRQKVPRGRDARDARRWSSFPSHNNFLRVLDVGVAMTVRPRDVHVVRADDVPHRRWIVGLSKRCHLEVDDVSRTSVAHGVTSRKPPAIAQACQDEHQVLYAVEPIVRETIRPPHLCDDDDAYWIIVGWSRGRVARAVVGAFCGAIPAFRGTISQSPHGCAARYDGIP